MEQAVLTALKDSIAKWERNAVAYNPWEYSIASYDCPLCVMFNNQKALCGGCPVYELTGKTGCRETPYNKADDALIKWKKFPEAKNGRMARKAACEEVAFLKSLLPEGEQTC